MTLLHTLLVAISLLLPHAGPAASRPVGPESSLANLACPLEHSACVIQRRTDHPLPARLLLESLDETALDEEDTDEIEISAVVSQVVFGENSFPTALLDPTCPQRLHSVTPSTQSVLRC